MLVIVTGWISYSPCYCCASLCVPLNLLTVCRTTITCGWSYHYQGPIYTLNWLTLKLDWSVRVGYLHTCAMFHASMTNSLWDIPFSGTGFWLVSRMATLVFLWSFFWIFWVLSYRFHWSRSNFANEISRFANEWPQHRRPCFPPEKRFHGTGVPIWLLVCWVFQVPFSRALISLAHRSHDRLPTLYTSCSLCYSHFLLLSKPYHWFPVV